MSKDEVQAFWDRKPCNSGWKFGDDAPFGTKEFFDQVEHRKYFVGSSFFFGSPLFFFDTNSQNTIFLNLPNLRSGMGRKFWKLVAACARLRSLSPRPRPMFSLLSRNALLIHDVLFSPSDYCHRFVPEKHGALPKEIRSVQHFLRTTQVPAGVSCFFFSKEKIRTYVGDAENLSKYVPVEKYDLIWSFGVIHHSPYPDRSVKEFVKYMDDGIFSHFFFLIQILILSHRHCFETDALLESQLQIVLDHEPHPAMGPQRHGRNCRPLLGGCGG